MNPGTGGIGASPTQHLARPDGRARPGAPNAAPRPPGRPIPSAGPIPSAVASPVAPSSRPPAPFPPSVPVPVLGPPTVGPDPVAVALRRPWQVTFYGWWVIVGVVLMTISEIVWIVFLVQSGLLDLDEGTTTHTDVYGDTSVTTTTSIDFAVPPRLLLLFSLIVFIAVLIELAIAVAFLRGSRGAYLYHSVNLILKLVVPILLVVLVVATVLLGTGTSAVNLGLGS